MKNNILTSILLVLLTGCNYTLSYYPLYLNEDLFANDILLGEYSSVYEIEEEDTTTLLWKFEYGYHSAADADSTIYRIYIADPNDSLNTDWEFTDLEARIVKIKESYFVDFLPFKVSPELSIFDEHPAPYPSFCCPVPYSFPSADSTNLEEKYIFPSFCVPFHCFAKIEFNSDSVSLFFPDPDWMKEKAKKKRVKLDYDLTYDEGVSIFSKTDKLQKFMAKYSGEDGFYKKEPVVFHKR